MKAVPLKRRLPQWLLAACLIPVAAVLGSCASSGYYRLDVQYLPQKADLAADSTLQQYMITVAQFNDERTGLTDAAALGKRIKADGSELKAISQQRTPGEVVGAAVKSAFFKNGFTVYGGMPDWDAAERSLQKNWGAVVVGGYIDELETVCRTGFLSAEYDTTVKLRVVFADPQHKRTLYTRTLESASNYKHFYFSKNRMEQELNNALSAAIEKMFDDNRVDEIIDELSRPAVKTIQ
jgi:hypothetical protein